MNDNYYLTIHEKRVELEKLLNKLAVKEGHEQGEILSKVWALLEKSILVDNLSESLVESIHENKSLRERIVELEGILTKMREFLDVGVNNVQKKM